MLLALPVRQAVVNGSLALLLGACIAPASKPDRMGLKLSPAALGESISLQQRLDVAGRGHSGQLDVALEVDAARLDLVGLALGQRVLSLHFDGETLNSWRHPMWPTQLRDQDVLENLQLTLWPVDVIRQALPTGWSIEESGLRRTILRNDLPVILIDYSALPPWSGKVEVVNLQLDYRIIIQSVSNEP